MTDSRSKTRELLEQLASTEYRRSMRADQIFRTLREEKDAEERAARAEQERRQDD
ncbi:hypothetical protein HK107_09485 [Parvularcula sp. ZS-1/3]|uniref:Uncharacterized protein n=1 Tax=Parvularcula mediterranea TaxID=2732508 RepID=A0A7Y3W5R6_9PROT|nr:hypothetical protein [Parvularcula mediterranea]NNU16551.1 hypothetical protein [Parvularcula mediterranea]